jgi:hypothetical protein
MAYDFYLDRIRLPVTPSKLQVKINGRNKTLTLINEGEINVLKQPGLTDISFSALLPNVKYPFADSDNATDILGELRRLITRTDDAGKFMPFQFKVTRVMPNGKMLFGNDIMVALEDYKINEDAKNGFDVTVEIALREHKAYGTKIVEITAPVPDRPQTATALAQRPAESAPSAKTYTVTGGDSLWSIAKLMLGDGSRYPEIYALNQAVIDARNKGTGNLKYTIYPGQIFTLP